MWGGPPGIRRGQMEHPVGYDSRVIHPQQQQRDRARYPNQQPAFSPAFVVLPQQDTYSPAESYALAERYIAPPERFIPFHDTYVPTVKPEYISPPVVIKEKIHHRDRERQELEATGTHAKAILRKGCDPAALPSASNYIRCSTLDSTLNVTLTEYGVQVTTDPHQVLLWGGIRANVGVVSGKWCYECRYMSSHGGNKPEEFSVMRVGWSLEMSDRISLGEDDMSFAFDSNGMISHKGVFTQHSPAFEVGDTVGCFIDLDTFTISYAINGETLGVANIIPENLRGKCFFPHVNMRNGTARFNFHPPSIIEGFPSDDFKFIGMAPDDVIETRPCEERPRGDCEVIFLVGLPSSGKSHWAAQQMREHPEKNYTILSNKQIFNQMKLRGPFSKERLEEVNKQCTAFLASILTDNPRKPQQLRNYIIDQPNVYQSGRRRRLRLFKGFVKHAVVFCPPEEKHAEYRALAAKEGTTIDTMSDEEVKKLAENFEPPVVSSVEFDRVTYVDTTAEELEAAVAKFKVQAEKPKKRPAVEEPVQEDKKPEQPPIPFLFPDQKIEMFMPPGIDTPEGGMPDYATAMVNYQAFLLAQQHMFLQSQIATGGEEAIEEQRQQLAQLQELAQQREQLGLMAVPSGAEVIKGQELEHPQAMDTSPQPVETVKPS